MLLGHGVVDFSNLGRELVMASLSARRSLGTTIKIAATLVILLAPFSTPAQTAGALPPDGCGQSVLPDGESSSVAMDRRVGKALNRAIRKINAEEYTDARASVGQVKLDQLTPYELAMAEGVLFRIANAEQKYDEARQHVVRAVASCGLTDQGIAYAQESLMILDARLGEARLVADWAESPCVKPGANAISSEGPSEPSTEERLQAFRYLYVSVVGYARCTDVKNKLAASTNASPEQLSQLAMERTAAIEELELQAAIFEERFGYPDGVDVLIARLRGPCGSDVLCQASTRRPPARQPAYTRSPWPSSMFGLRHPPSGQ
jgi:hypothetical protein